ncbi:MAG: FAD-dependent oxidoreductase [Mycobacterium sp.]
MTRRHKVVILGGGMAGLSAAWRLSEPGWRDHLESITLFQRGWRLGGKGASSRGIHDRIEEHGLHVWLGSYDNAFALLRECYAELDRATTDPAAPIQTWDQALIPSDELGMADKWGTDWQVWSGRFRRNRDLPGEPDSTGRELTVVEFVRRALELLLDFADSLHPCGSPGLVLTTTPAPHGDTVVDMLRRSVFAVLASLSVAPTSEALRAGLLGVPAEQLRQELDGERRPEQRRFWLLASLLTATARGLLSDDLISDPQGFRAINDEEYGDWLLRHGAHPDVLDHPLIRGLYDMVFGYVDGDCDRRALAAGTAVLLTGIALFQYRGAFFWKMTAGMGDVVIAPLYQALRRRGVDFEFFHRVDSLQLDPGRTRVEGIAVGRQVELAAGADRYEPLITCRGLPVFPDELLTDQLDPGRQTSGVETHFGRRHDVEIRQLRRGADFDQVVLATSLGMIPLIAQELIEDSPDWSDMVNQVRTVATQSFQLWLRPTESEMGWDRPGVTTSGYVAPFDTWASMPQTLWAEDWPAADRPQTVAYFCGVLDAEWPTDVDHDQYLADCRQRVITTARNHLDHHLGLFLPGAVTGAGFTWSLLCGAGALEGGAALATQHVSVNVDPSDRYVQSVPGSDRFRLRPDESGYDNLFLAGDWTDSGINAGCIEAAVISGLQAANALLGRGRYHRIRGFYLP